MGRKTAADIDLQQNQLQNVVIENLSSAPSTPVIGQIYFDTTLDVYRVYIDNNGDERWVDITDAFQKSYVNGGKVNYVSVTAVTIGTSGENSYIRDYADSFNITWSGTISINITAAGAGGLDTGSEASNTWYAIHVIADSSGTNPVSGIFSTSATSPTLPSGYDKFRRLGWIRNDSSSDFIPALYVGKCNYRKVLYRNSITFRQVLSSGTATSYTAVDLSSFVPPTTQIFSLYALEYGDELMTLLDDPTWLFPQYIVFGDADDSTNLHIDNAFCNSSQQIYYSHGSGGGGNPSANLYVQGFTDEI